MKLSLYSIYSMYCIFLLQFMPACALNPAKWITSTETDRTIDVVLCIPEFYAHTFTCEQGETFLLIRALSAYGSVIMSGMYIEELQNKIALALTFKPHDGPPQLVTLIVPIKIALNAIKVTCAKKCIKLTFPKQERVRKLCSLVIKRTKDRASLRS